MTKSTLSLASIAASLWADVSAIGARIETDMKTLTDALCLSNDPSGLQTLYDEAFSAASAADKASRGAVTGRYHLLAMRAHYWAGQAGFVLSLPRLDGKGSVTTPSVTPKDTAKLEAQGKAAERKAKADKALADMSARNAQRTADAVKALTPTDIAQSVLALCEGSGVHPMEVICTLSDSMRNEDLRSLADVLADVLAVREYATDARNPAIAMPDAAALPDVSPAPSKRGQRRQA